MTPETLRDDMRARQQFAEDFLDWACDDPEDYFGNEWSETLNPYLEANGFLIHEAYDPATHGEHEDFEPGEMIWWFTPRAYAAARASRERRTAVRA